MYVVQSFLYLREDFLCYENIFNYNKENKGKKQKMKIAICDDEKKASEALLEILEECPEPIEKTDVYFSGEELLRSTEQYDLLFLDIDMEGIDGIETARKIRLKDKKVKIVYVTAYSEYAGKAFSVHAFGYLLKPVKKTSVLKQVADALAYREEEQKPSPVLEFETSQGRTRLHTADIYYFEIRGRQIKLSAEKGCYEMRGKIGDLRERMRDYGFASPHKSFVVNLDQIRNIKGYDIYMMNGEILPLSQKQAVSFKECLGRFLAEKNGSSF